MPEHGNTPLHHALAVNVKKLMKESTQYDTQAKLAVAVGVDQATISRIINGKYPTSIDHVEAVAKVFGLTAWQLLVPNMDPKNPPEPLTRAEKAVIEQIRSVVTE